MLSKQTKPNPDNPNAFKHSINEALLERMALALKTAQSDFDKTKFIAKANELEALELKPRVRWIRDQLHHQLPKDYPKAVGVLLKSLEKKNLKGFDLWPYTEFIQTFGLNHLDLSLNTLKTLTSLFTAEFAVRPFLNAHPQKTLSFLLKCSLDPSVHVRRWASEGSRPRLPWGEKLHLLIKDPELTLPILENLKFDEELYVRKSVANHLNDISKDHPGLVLRTLKKWKQTAKAKDLAKINWIISRSLRTLIKTGHPKALSLIGVTESLVKVSTLRLNQKIFKLNERLELEFSIVSHSQKVQKLVVDYIVHYQKSNGTMSPKVFKMKTFIIGPKEKVKIKKSHHLKQVTTRKHYGGKHLVEIQINGKVHSRAKWDLKL